MRNTIRTQQQSYATLNCVHSVVELLEDIASVLALNGGIGNEMNVTVLVVTGNTFSIVVERVSVHCMETLPLLHDLFPPIRIISVPCNLLVENSVL